MEEDIAIADIKVQMEGEIWFPRLRWLSHRNSLLFPIPPVGCSPQTAY